MNRKPSRFHHGSDTGIWDKLRTYTTLVIGGGDMEAGAVSVRLHYGGPGAAEPKWEVVADILAAIRERRA
ncbi:MAG: hypothetical protein U1F83_17200 [Verrucomicrobiota bacterium]